MFYVCVTRKKYAYCYADSGRYLYNTAILQGPLINDHKIIKERLDALRRPLKVDKEFYDRVCQFAKTRRIL